MVSNHARLDTMIGVLGRDSEPETFLTDSSYTNPNTIQIIERNHRKLEMIFFPIGFERKMEGCHRSVVRKRPRPGPTF